MRPGTARLATPWLAIAAAIVVAMLLLHISALSVRVYGASMSPYAPEGALLLVNTAAPLNRGDVVVVEAPVTWAPGAPERIVKRVVAIEGDRISCCDRESGMVVLNGAEIAEPYLADDTAASSIGFDVRVPEGHVWLLGDNRAISLDSRHRISDDTAGAVPRSNVVGVVWARFPPW